MARACVYICDRCATETREINKLEPITAKSGYERELCPSCMQKLMDFIKFGSTTGDRFYQAEVVHVAADVIKENAGNLQGRDAVRLEGELRTIGSILEED